MEQTTCEVADSVQAYKCQTEEQCDDCFMVDHLKECEWCEHYDHPVRKLKVQHLASDCPSDENEGDRTAADFADAEPTNETPEYEG
jgi:hypothetical protein